MKWVNWEEDKEKAKGGEEPNIEDYENEEPNKIKPIRTQNDDDILTEGYGEFHESLTNDWEKTFSQQTFQHGGLA